MGANAGTVKKGHAIRQELNACASPFARTSMAHLSSAATTAAEAVAGSVHLEMHGVVRKPGTSACALPSAAARSVVPINAEVAAAHAAAGWPAT